MSLRFTRSCMKSFCVTMLLAASASGFADADVAERYSGADQVSLVKVSRVGNLVNPAMTSRGMLAVEGLTYTVQVLKEWKGAGENNLTFRVDFNNCVNMLRKDEVYLVFSHQNDDGNLQAYNCDDLINAEAAEEVVAQLDDLSRMTVAQSL